MPTPSFDKIIDITQLGRFKTNLESVFATKDVATSSSAGLMSASDKATLDSLASLVDADARTY